MAHAISFTNLETNQQQTIPLCQILTATEGDTGQTVIKLVNGLEITTEEPYRHLSEKMRKNEMPFLSVEQAH